MQFRLKPLRLVARITPVLVSEEPPVQVVASLHIHSNDSSLIVPWERFGVVPKLAKDCDFFLGQPVVILPCVLEVVNSPVLTRFGEVLDVHGPGVVVSLDRKDLNGGVGSK